MIKDEALYAERLRLVLGGIAQSLPVGFLLATLLALVFLLTSAHHFTARLASSGEDVSVVTASIAVYPLAFWYALALTGRLVLVIHARRLLRLEVPVGRLSRVTRMIAFGQCYEGIVWGSLCWIVVQENSSPAATALLLGVMAASSSNAVALFAPIRSLYVVLMVPMLILTGCRFLVMDSLIYQAVGVACILYVAGQYGQASWIGRRLNEAIKLRFENLELIKHLEAEKTLASQARELAEQANAAKSRFLAAASHDLRQPVHALGLFLEAMSCGRVDDAQRAILDNAKAASLASTEMLNTLLDFSRIEAGVIRPTPVPYRIQAMLHKLERELAPQADAKGLIYRTRDSEATVLTDPGLLELILRNLIANAIRYTDTGGLLIGCRQRGDQLSVEVFDTGIGIAVAQQQEVFREFYQLGNPERDRRKGLGLGLAIAQGLSKSLDHCLSLDSVLGRGSVFRLQLPLSIQPIITTQIESSRPADSAALKGRHVLVIDDDEGVRAAMHGLLSSWGCLTQAVESLEAAQTLKDVTPEAIVCDYRLRESRNGAEVIQALRTFYGCALPALLVTGDTAPERLKEAADSGLPLLHKPVAPDQLWSALVRLLARDEDPATDRAVG